MYFEPRRTVCEYYPPMPSPNDQPWSLSHRDYLILQHDGWIFENSHALFSDSVFGEDHGLAKAAWISNPDDLSDSLGSKEIVKRIAAEHLHEGNTFMGAWLFFYEN